MALEVGAVVEGRVTGITKFGAFVALPEGKSGLVHISEISDNYVKQPSDVLKVGQVVKVRVLSVDVKKNRIGLVRKQVTTKEIFRGEFSS